MNQSAKELRADLAQSFVVGIAPPQAGPEELAWFGRHGLGGVILFARNVLDPEQVWRLNYELRLAAREANRPPLFVMVDQEGGSVARLKGPFTHGPDMAELGRSNDAARLEAHGRSMGRELLAAGFNWNLAPVLDVHAIDHGIMSRRSLGGDPEAVSRLGAAFIKGLQAQGVLACAKHFPGLGRTTLDTHREKPLVGLALDELKALELKPFQAAMAGGVAGVMVCHAVFSALDPHNPASLSEKAVSGFLRAELGWQGAVLTDDLEMGALAADLDPAQAAVKAYLAGCDLLLICHRPELALEALDELCRLAEQGSLPRERIAQSKKRLAGLKAKLPHLPGSREALRALLAAKAEKV